MADVSIVIKADDQYTNSVEKMLKYNRELAKSLKDPTDRLGELTKKVGALSTSEMRMRTEMDEAKKKLKEAEAAFKATGSSADGLNLQMQRGNYSNMVNNLKLVQNELKSTTKEMNEMARRAGESGEQVKSKLTVSLEDLGKLDIYKKIGSLVGQFGGSLASGIFGEGMGGAISGTISNTLEGALTGGWLGALWGAGTGIAQGALNIKKEQWDTSDQLALETLQTAQEAGADALENGKGVYGSRETDLVSFSTLFGGADKAESYLDQLHDFANVTPFLYDDLTTLSKTLKTFGYAAEDMIPTLQKVGDAGAALGLDSSSINTVATAIGRMKSSDKATLEYLNQLNERGLAVFDWLAADRGESQKDLYADISGGNVSGVYAADLILSKFDALYGGMMEEQSKTYEGLTSTLEGYESDFQAAYGKGYDETRKDAMAEAIAAYQGPLGEAMQSVNEMIGAGAALRDNLQEKLNADILNAIFAGGTLDESLGYHDDTMNRVQEMQAEFNQLKADYESAMAAGDETAAAEAAAQIEALRDTAASMAENEFNASEMMADYTDAQITTTEAVLRNTDALDAATNAYRLAQSQSKSGWFLNLTAGDEDIADVAAQMQGQGILAAGEIYANSHAGGLRRVPYDNYRAMLHQGERVLTAAEARAADRGQGGDISISFAGANFTVRNDSDIDAIAQALYDKLAQAQAIRG